MKDKLVKALAYNDSVRMYVVTTKNAVNKIGDKFGYYPSALAALGRTLNVGVIMGGMLKGDQTVTVRVDGNGPIGKIVIDADAKGNVRGYVTDPHCHFEYTDKKKLNVRATVGDKGYINIIKDLNLKEPFVGTIPLIDGELGVDFAYYFSVSEQIPSVVSLGVLVETDSRASQSGGYIIQLLPNTSDEIIDKIEKIVKEIPSMSDLLNAGKSHNDILNMLSDGDYRIVEETDVNCSCNCNKEKFLRGIISLGKDEINEMIKDNKTIETTCHFCGENYYFTIDELKEILEKL